jgi:hypothetical protein
MTGSASHKYTDRDVRENELEMRHFVESYLERYHGEFEFLIDCKMRVAEGYTLSTGMVRGVLNCMRNDPRVKGLPAPLPPLEDDADVIELRGPRGFRARRPEVFSAREPEIVIPREYRPYHADTKAHVNFTYAISKSLSMLHRIDRERDAVVEWVIHPDRTMPRRFDRIRVPVLCKNPHWLTYRSLSPLWVLTFTNKQKAMSALKKQNPDVTLCVRCFPEADG